MMAGSRQADGNGRLSQVVRNEQTKKAINYVNTSGIGDRAERQNCKAMLQKLKLRYFI